MRAASSLPMMIRASDPPMKYRLTPESGKVFELSLISHAPCFPKSVHCYDNVQLCDVKRIRNTVMILRPIQCRMARTALGMGVRELAAAAKVSVDTVARFERGEDLKERTIDALQRALEAAGIILIDENGGWPGVRLRKRQRKKT